MKDKIILFVIGVLVGAIIATGAFYVYTTSNDSCNQNMQMNGGTPPEMPNNSNGQPPERPDGQMNEMPSNTNQSSN